MWREALSSRRAGLSEHHRAWVALLVMAALELGPAAATENAPNVDAIVRRWAAANHADFRAAPTYDYRETIRNDDGTKTYDVMMVLGSPYKRLLAVGGKPLSDDDRRSEDEKLAEERRTRAAESPEERADRLADYRDDRERANRILQEVPRAFIFHLRQMRPAGSRAVYVLDAEPRPGYKPPTTEAKVLTGMRGEFWIDTIAFQLVHGTARVLEPVSIAGFLAKIQPGTEFIVEQQPVDDGIWLPTRFEIRSQSSILFVFHHHLSEERTYFDYRKISTSP